MAPGKLPDAQLAQIGAALKLTRQRRGLSAAGLDRLVGASGTTSQVERGRSGLSLALVFAYAAALDCSWNELLGPPPGDDGHDPDWQAGYRAGLGDAIGALRALLDHHGDHG